MKHFILVLITISTLNSSWLDSSFLYSSPGIEFCKANTFNADTNHLEFDIPKYNNVRLEIFDMSGEKVEELVNQNLNAGHYQVQWDASKYSSGAYISKLTTADYSATKKMILVK